MLKKIDNQIIYLKVKYFSNIILFIILIIPLYSNENLGNPFIKNYTSLEYNAYPQNWNVIQDSRGVLYSANGTGILEFNGKNWHLITVLNKSVVRSLTIDKVGTIYVGAVSEFGYLAINNIGNWIYISLKNKLPVNEQNITDIWDCQATSQGVYFLTREKIFRWHQQRLEIIPVDLQSFFGIVINDRLYIVNRLKGISTINENQLQYLPQSNEFIFPNSGRLVILSYIKKDTILIVTEKKGLFIYHLKTSAGECPWEIFPSSISNYLLENSLYKGVMINPNLYAFATLRGGIILMDDLGKPIQIINKSNGLWDNAVYGLHVDKEQNLWAALNNGLSYIQINSPITSFNESNGLDGIILSICKYHDQLYIGNFFGIFYLSTSRNKSNDHPLHFKQVKNTINGCFDFITIKDILLGSGVQGYYQIVGEEAFLTEGPTPYCFGFTSRFPHIAFVGTGNGFLALEIEGSSSNRDDKIKTAAINVINSGSFQEITEPIRCIACDAMKNLWLTTQYNGNLYLKFNSDKIFDFSITRYGIEDGLPDLKENKMYSVNQQLLAATQNGIYKVVVNKTKKTDSKPFFFIKDPMFTNLFNDGTNFGISKIYLDTMGRYWINSIKGIISSSKNQEGKFISDHIPFNCLKGDITNFLIEENGIAWFCGGSNQSLFRFDSNMKKNYRSDFHAILSTVIAGKETVLFNGNYYNSAIKNEGYFLRSSLTQPDQLKIKLPFHKNSLRFLYSAAFYEHISDNRFSYQLVGFDKEWSNWTEEDKAIYTNIPEGRYVFKIKAKNVWEHESSLATYEFYISPPWHRTWWAYSNFALILILLFYSGIKLNSRRILAAKERLEKIVAERTAELIIKNKKITAQKEEIVKQKDEIENYAEKLKETTDALWGEMELAKKIQTVLLPENPQIPGYEISAYMQPADEVGGDYYDVICIDNNDRRGGSCARPNDFGQFPKTNPENPSNLLPGQPQGFAPTDPLTIYPISPRSGGSGTNHQPFIPSESKDKAGFIPVGLTTASSPTHWLAIGDVSGHGVPAGLVMMMVQTAIRSVLENEGYSSPEIILKKVNRVIYENIKKLGEDKYMTLTLMSIQSDGTIFYSGLHQDILLYRAAAKKVEVIETKGMWIGMVQDIQDMINVESLQLQSKDTMLLYTDGITEAIDSENTMFSEAQLNKLFSDIGCGSVENIKASLLSALNNYTCHDDVTLLIIQKQ